MTDISHARLLGISIMLNEALTADERRKILKGWEKVTFRIFGLHRRDARTKLGNMCVFQERFSLELIVSPLQKYY